MARSVPEVRHDIVAVQKYIAEAHRQEDPAMLDRATTRLDALQAELAAAEAAANRSMLML